MKLSVLVAACLLTGSAYAEKIESTSKVQIVDIECRGQAENLGLMMNIWANPKTLETQVVRFDLSLMVSRWNQNKDIEEYYGTDVKSKGSYIGLVGELESGKGSYDMSIPKYSIQQSGEFEEFTTSVGLKGEFYEGTMNLRCKALVKTISAKYIHNIRW